MTKKLLVYSHSGASAFNFLLQVSVLRVFHQLLASASFRRQPGSSEVLGFAVRVVRHIFERLVPVAAAETVGKLLPGEFSSWALSRLQA